MFKVCERLNPKLVYIVLLVATLSIYMVLNTNSLAILNAYLNNEVYSYLYITPLSVAILLYGMVSRENIGISLKSLLTGLALLYLALLSLYCSARTPYIDQLLVLTIVLGVYGLVIMFIGGYNLKKILLVTPFILLAIPIPLAIVFDLSAYLTRITGHLAVGLAKLLGTTLEYTVREGQQVVVINTPDGKAYLSLAPVCSGIIGLTSVLGVSPVIAFLAYRVNRREWYKKIGIFFIGMTVLTVLMFLANVLRLTIVFITTSYFGISIGYGLFHYTPEIVFIPPIAYIVIRVVEKIGNGIDLSFKPPRIVIGSKHLFYKQVGFIVACILPLMLISSALSIASPNQYFINTYEGPPALIDKKGVVYENLFSEYSREFTIRYIGRNPNWEELLGSTTRVHEYLLIMLERGVEYHVYIEFSQQASQIHIWELCLKWQGITNFTSRRMTLVSPDQRYLADASEINFTHGLTHGYIVYWRDKVYTENGLEYFRFSVIVTNTSPVDPIYKHLALQITRDMWVKFLNTSYLVYSVQTINEDIVLYSTVYYTIVSIVYVVSTSTRDFTSFLERIRIWYLEKKKH